MNCLICNSNSKEFFSHLVLNQHKVNYFKCVKCNHIQTEKPYWLEDAYNSVINIEDTGLLQRNISASRILSSLFFALNMNPDKMYLDHGGGYGVLTRLMRDVGFNFYWHDQYCNNLFAENFSAKLKNNKFECITLLEVAEHLYNPKQFFNLLSKHTDSIFFTTTLHNEFLTQPNLNWKYYGFQHGQHISFFSIQSLHELSTSLKMNLYTDKRSTHILTRLKLSNSAIKLAIRLSPILSNLARIRYKSLTQQDSKIAR